jgi:hypothetical protein
LQQADNPAGIFFQLAQVGQRGVNVRQAIFVVVAQRPHYRVGRRTDDVDGALDTQGCTDWHQGPQTGGDVGFQYGESKSFSVICNQLRQSKVFVGTHDSSYALLGRIDAATMTLAGP